MHNKSVPYRLSANVKDFLIDLHIGYLSVDFGYLIVLNFLKYISSKKQTKLTYDLNMTCLLCKCGSTKNMDSMNEV